MITIRPAIYQDLFGLEQLLMEVFKETDFYPPPVLPAAYHAALQQIQRGMILVAAEETEETSALVGLMWLHTEEWSHHPGKGYLTNTHYYVVPGSRNRRVDGRLVSEALLEAAKDLADSKNIPLLVRVTFGERVDAKARFMERSGMRCTGGIFLHTKQELPHQQAPPQREAA